MPRNPLKFDVSGATSHIRANVSSEREKNGALAAARLTARLVAGQARTSVTERLTDAWLGAQTREIVKNRERLSEISAGHDGHSYEPVQLAWWRRLNSAVPLDPRQSTFIDMGAGKGRALLLAARRGYRTIIGVEIDEQLVAAAHANVDRLVARGRLAADTVSIVSTDAAQFDYPSGPLAVFFFNPFGAQTMRLTLDRLAASREVDESEAYVAYFNPTEDAIVASHPSFALHDHGRDWAVYRFRR